MHPCPAFGKAGVCRGGAYALSRSTSALASSKAIISCRFSSYCEAPISRHSFAALIPSTPSAAALSLARANGVISHYYECQSVTGAQPSIICDVGSLTCVAVPMVRTVHSLPLSAPLCGHVVLLSDFIARGDLVCPGLRARVC
eukprot:scaffold263427_cov45-Tisochrysis_lutea.AAC.1